MEDFYLGALNVESINGSYITLIPKNESPITVADFRPTSLLNCSVKLITKLLANRLQKKIMELIHINQYGFIKNRLIQDCLAWSLECLHLCHKSGNELIILKLDFEKAFGKIEHEFMMQIMRYKGFGNKWLHWMSLIFSSGTSSILLNGVPGKVFHCKRGVRQGDPLSPLLFVLAADFLQTLLNKATSDSLLELPLPANVAGNYPVIQYADDTLLFMKSFPQQLHALKDILTGFAHDSGLKVNFHKSMIVPINTPDEPLLALTSVLGCSIGSLPFTYLGMPLGLKKPSASDLMPLVKKCEKRLLVTANMLSQGGKLVLVNSVLSSYPTFLMGLLKVHKTIIKHLDK